MCKGSREQQAALDCDTPFRVPMVVGRDGLVRVGQEAVLTHNRLLFEIPRSSAVDVNNISQCHRSTEDSLRPSRDTGDSQE